MVPYSPYVRSRLASVERSNMGVYRQQTADNAPGRELLNRSAHIRLTSRLTAVFMLMKSSAEPQMTFYAQANQR